MLLISGPLRKLITGILVGEDLEEDVDVNITDEDKFIPVRPEDEATPEEEEIGFIKIPTADPDELQGANFAEDAWNDVEKQILDLMKI